MKTNSKQFLPQVIILFFLAANLPEKAGIKIFRILIFSVYYLLQFHIFL